MEPEMDTGNLFDSETHSEGLVNSKRILATFFEPETDTGNLLEPGTWNPAHIQRALLNPKRILGTFWNPKHIQRAFLNPKPSCLLLFSHEP